jgi:SAM-dependent methyltransferase/uncharacterized protein YbaR (Trm112 family)
LNENTSRFSRLLHILRCPRCRGGFRLNAGDLVCNSCAARFSSGNGVPALLDSAVEETSQADAGNSIRRRIRDFYEENPFPDYDGFEDVATLLERAGEGVFARLLDEQIPFGSRVLECGCGTGQLSNFLGIAHRTVIGTDLSTASLRLAESFRQKHSLDRIFFLQMDLFRPVFPEQCFDFVISNGVLHHTHAPREGMAVLSRLVRPGGYLIIGLYHRYGRLATDLRRFLFRVVGPRFLFLDPRYRRLHRSRRWKAWFADQYRNPHESKHTICSVSKWLPQLGLEFVKSIPKTQLSAKFSEDERLFEPEAPGTRLETALCEVAQTVAGASEGGFFTLIARRTR